MQRETNTMEEKERKKKRTMEEKELRVYNRVKGRIINEKRRKDGR